MIQNLRRQNDIILRFDWLVDLDRPISWQIKKIVPLKGYFVGHAPNPGNLGQSGDRKTIREGFFYQVNKPLWTRHTKLPFLHLNFTLMEIPG
jgi:hypothetical protein